MHRKLAYSVVYKTNSPISPLSAQPETVRDYFIEGMVGGKRTLLCNVTGNYQRRRVHTLPCPPPDPHAGPPPPPVNPVVTKGSVSATICDAGSAAQRWTMPPHAGAAVRSADGALCLGYDANTSAFGGHGNSVVARPCGASPTAWKWSEEAGGSFLRTAEPPHGLPKSRCAPQGYCECVHPVACTACHGTDEYKAPTSVELYDCSAAGASHMKWSSLKVNDGSTPGAAPQGLLMTGGLCLQAPANQSAVYAAPAPAQRVQAKSAVDRRAEAASVSAVSSVLITVTATNGVADARINEVRLYDAGGVEPFPVKPAEA